MINNLPSVSVIIPAKNSSTYIKECIESVLNCGYQRDKLEIILVDNGSEDDTAKIASSLADSVLILPKISISALRNRGAETANNEILVFLDSDCTVLDNWLETGIQTLNDESIYKSSIVGSNHLVPPDAKWLEKAWCSQQIKGLTEASHIPSGNLFIKKEIFNKLGGFNESLTTGEDYDLCQRARKYGLIISNTDIKAIHHGNPKNLKQMFKREIWHGLGGLYFYKNNIINKPLIAAIIFSFSLIFLFLGLLLYFFTGDNFLVLIGSLGVITIMTLTLLYKRKFIKNTLQAFQLGLLYMIFYLGRFISIPFYFFKRDFYHKR